MTVQAAVAEKLMFKKSTV